MYDPSGTEIPRGWGGGGSNRENHLLGGGGDVWIFSGITQFAFAESLKFL